MNKNYSSPDLDKTRLGEVVDLISDITLVNKHSDVLGRVYEYFLNQFGKRDGEFYTPQSIVRLLVEMIEPYKGGFTTLVVVLVGCLFNQINSFRNTKERSVTYPSMVKSLMRLVGN